MTSLSRMSTDRIRGIDALRGCAVLLMVEQHCGAWLWNTGSGRLADMASSHPLMLGFNALGGLAAPLFCLLAGVGVTLLAGSAHKQTANLLVRRGLMIVGLGYLLNLLTPGWFSPGSWYILHLIGTGMVLAPLMVWQRSSVVLIFAMAVLFTTPVINTLLNTPVELGNARMRDMGLAGGIVRLAIAEGQFPLFPWLSILLTGIVAGRWVRDSAQKKIVASAASCLILGAALSALGCIPWMDQHPLLHRSTCLTAEFYPLSPPLLLLLLGVALLLLWIATKQPVARFYPLACLGRVSLTILFLHIIIIREGGQRFGFFRTFEALPAIAIIIAIASLLLILATLWARARFRFGFEWLVRKVAG
jgi:uncharacterized membrane protein